MLPASRLSDFSSRVVVAVLITLALVALAYVCWRGISVLLEAFAGVLFAVFLSALSDWLSQHTRLTRGWALLVVVLALILLAAGIGWFLANSLTAQLGELEKELPQSLQRLQQYLEKYPWGRRLLEQVPGAANSLTQVGEFSRVTGFISGVADMLITVVVILFVGLFGAAEPQLYRAGLLHLMPAGQRRRVGQAVDAVAFNLRWWLVGQVFLMVVIGVTTMVGLRLIGVKLALTLGLMAGILELIPYLGPWLSAIPAALIALLLSPTHLLLTLGLYLFLHILEGYVLLPIIQRRAVLVPPALTLVAQVLLGNLLGLMGVFVAAPLTVVVIVLLKMLYVEDTLGDQAVDVPGEPGNKRKVAARAEAAVVTEVPPQK